MRNVNLIDTMESLLFSGQVAYLLDGTKIVAGYVVQVRQVVGTLEQVLNSLHREVELLSDMPKNPHIRFAVKIVRVEHNSFFLLTGVILEDRGFALKMAAALHLSVVYSLTDECNIGTGIDIGINPVSMSYEAIQEFASSYAVTSLNVVSDINTEVH